MTRRAARVDANHGEIVAEFRRLGCAVQSLAGMGQGVPDLLVCMHGRNELVEVKTEKGKLTPDQVKWFEAWPGDVFAVRSVSDARSLRELLGYNWRDQAVFAYGWKNQS